MQSLHVSTTLYDLIEAVSEQVSATEQCLVVPVVQNLLKTCRAGFLFRGPAHIGKSDSPSDCLSRHGGAAPM
jgi:hypothetical protein